MKHLKWHNWLTFGFIGGVLLVSSGEAAVDWYHARQLKSLRYPHGWEVWVAPRSVVLYNGDGVFRFDYSSDVFHLYSGDIKEFEQWVRSGQRVK